MQRFLNYKRDGVHPNLEEENKKSMSNMQTWINKNSKTNGALRYSKSIIQFISQCINNNPTQRLNVDRGLKIIEHQKALIEFNCNIDDHDVNTCTPPLIDACNPHTFLTPKERCDVIKRLTAAFVKKLKLIDQVVNGNSA